MMLPPLGHPCHPTTPVSPLLQDREHVRALHRVGAALPLWAREPRFRTGMAQIHRQGGTHWPGVAVGTHYGDADLSLVSPPQSFVPPRAEELLALDFERVGRLNYKGGLDLERAREGWFALAGSALHVSSEDNQHQEPLQLRKLQELCACPGGPWGQGGVPQILPRWGSLRWVGCRSSSSLSSSSPGLESWGWSRTCWHGHPMGLGGLALPLGDPLCPGVTPIPRGDPLFPG